MAKFCQYCDNLLNAEFFNDELMFKCNKCQMLYKPNDEDTLRYELIKESNVMIFEKILNRVADDPVSLKTYKKCIKESCSGNIVKQIPIGDNLHLYNICIKCKEQWLN